MMQIDTHDRCFSLQSFHTQKLVLPEICIHYDVTYLTALIMEDVKIHNC